VPPAPEWALRVRAKWRWTGRERPPFAEPCAAGQESVWDYPRPPRIERDARVVGVSFGGHRVARSDRTLRVLETASPPTFYLPREDVVARLVRVQGGSRCEWKGEAGYWDVLVGSELVERGAWGYPKPFEEFAELAGWVSFYPGRFVCTVGGERVQPQPGGFYGGWVTSELVGPFKGEPGSEEW
jgi:uncharacterized protein (DUF427 family)